MKKNNQLEALTNAVNSTNLNGLTIHQHYNEDKRRTTPKFFLCLNKTSISPNLDYTNMNHFILGLSKGIKIVNQTATT